jgi:hypothetical protein
MNHSFNIEDAKTYGVNCAVILENIRFWVAKNKANDKHNYDGKYWTYNSIKAFHELFPYLTERQIRTALDKLVEVGIVQKGNYNQNPYDRTSWYSTEVKCTRQNDEMDLASDETPFDNEGKCIIGTDINTDINHIKEENFLHKQLESNTTKKNLGAAEWMKQISHDGENSWRYIHRQVKGNKPDATLAELKNKCTLFTEQEKGTSTRHEWTKHFINWCKYQKFTPKKESSIPSATHSDWKK